MLGKGHGGLYKIQQRKKETNDRLRGERNKIKLIDLCVERGQVERGLEEGKTRSILGKLLFDLVN